MHETHIYVGASVDPASRKWAAILIAGGHVREIKGDAKGETLNRAKLCAASMALSLLRGRHRVRIFTDLQYLARGLNEWLPTWCEHGLHGIKNDDIWALLGVIVPTHDVRAEWVPNFAASESGRRVTRLASSG